MGFYDRGKWVFMRGNSYLVGNRKIYREGFRGGNGNLSEIHKFICSGYLNTGLKPKFHSNRPLEGRFIDK